jgi:AAA family ATP:ADP antiporter
MAISRRSDSTAMAFAVLAATVIIGHQVAGKATRDALFLSNFDVTNLPKIVIAAAIASMAGVLVMSRLLAHISPIRLVPSIFGLSALLFVGEWLLLDYQPRAASVILYLHMAVFGAILISGFWSIINERFDPHSAKQRVARIAAAATLGGVIGGVLAARVSALMDVRSMLLFLSGLHVICLLATRGIGGPVTSAIPAGETVKTRSAFTVIARTRYLQWMALLMVLVAVMAALLDYALKSQAAVRYQDSESLVAFFASFYAIAGLAGFVLQTLLGRRILQRFGIGTTLAILPVSIAVFGTVGTVFTRLWSMVLLRGGHAIIVNSLFRSAFELLYTPLSPHKKRPTKAIIDVASDRLGDLIGSGLLLLLLFLVPQLPTAMVTGCAVLIALAILFVITRLNQGYIDQLARSLRSGAVDIKESDIVDATTQQILAESNAYSEREFLLSKLALMQERSALPDREIDASLQFANTVADLCSGDTDRIYRALGSSAMDIRLIPCIIPLLANDDISNDVRTELRWMVPRITGQLTDAMLDPDIPLRARQRLPGVLEASHNPRSIRGLLLGMVDQSFNVRYSCARSLARMRGRNRQLKIPQQQVFAAIRKELTATPGDWAARNRALQLEGSPDAEPAAKKIDRGVEHVFTLLALILDPDAVYLAMQATLSEDVNLRGTALEYLENVLPADLYQKLLTHLGSQHEGRYGQRSLGDIVRELKSLMHMPQSD